MCKGTKCESIVFFVECSRASSFKRSGIARPLEAPRSQMFSKHWEGGHGSVLRIFECLLGLEVTVNNWWLGALLAKKFTTASLRNHNGENVNNGPTNSFIGNELVILLMCLYSLIVCRQASIDSYKDLRTSPDEDSKLEPPPISMVCVTIQTLVNPQTHRLEPLMIGLLSHTSYPLHTTNQKASFQEHCCRWFLKIDY